MASYPHHTATTVYLCCVPALEDSTGAGCVGLAAANIQGLSIFARIFLIDLTKFANKFKAKSRENI